MADGWQATVLDVARRTGLEGPLREVQRVLESAESKRDRCDRNHLDLLIAFALPADANCVDIGANAGDVLERIVAHHPGGRHLAFEPLPDLAASLVERFPSVEVHNAAVADAAGTTTFFRNVGSSTRSSLDRGQAAQDDSEVVELTVDVEVLDEVLPDGYVPHLVKIDVEGFEGPLLRGAMRTLTTHRPIVVFEHGGPSAEAAGSRGIHQTLTEVGLRVLDIDGGGPYDEDAFAACVDRGALWNYVARV